MNSISKFINSLLVKSELLLEEIKGKKEQMLSHTKDIIVKDKSEEKEVTNEDISNYNKLALYSYIINDEYRKTMLKIIGVYNYAKVNSIELDLEESDIKVIEHFLKGEISQYYVDNKGKLIPRNPNLDEVLTKRVSESALNDKSKLLNSLRKSSLYEQKA